MPQKSKMCIEVQFVHQELANASLGGNRKLDQFQYLEPHFSHCQPTNHQLQYIKAQESEI